MKKIIIILASILTVTNILAQENKLYDPSADAEKEISAAIKKAKEQHKYILLMGGGNWCSWCVEFARLAKADPGIDSVMNAGFVTYHLNYSKENENKNTFARLGFPQRFGFPVFIILNEKGERIHTQNSEYLEDGHKSYNPVKVKEFLNMWSPAALNPELYNKKKK